MKYGFVIDHRKCIGCHACTVACKAEHQVPVGAFRTWVKYVEKGIYPDTRRFFSVLRCNHCDDAPCITICPVTALFRRDDGIVDFDGDRCIGCKSCMQACPYDALYINPNTNTAEKCNYCAHRVENQLEPACVIVCPVEAIVSGDLDDPSSRISRLVTSEHTMVRKPGARTHPKLFYIEANESALQPAEQTRSGGYLWSEQRMDALMADAEELAAIDAKARTTYDVAHDRPWGWKVSAYLWTKSIASGSFLIAALGIRLGFVRGGALFESIAPQISLVFLAITVALLIFDLKRPERFLRILFMPQWKSWLVIGGYILVAYGAVLTAWMLAPAVGLTSLEPALMWIGASLGIMSAVYSAFLFRQARGRVFWNSPLTALHLLAQAIACGSAALMIAAAISTLGRGGKLSGPGYEFLYYELIGSLVANGILMMGELFLPEENVERKRAARLVTHRTFSRLFWIGCVSMGLAVPVLMLAAGFGQYPLLAILSSLLALTGVFLWEHIWVQAGQALPLS
jgi:Fe-S-cluster-containing dehydrogenase component/formate-dependent nitrite reductase membrane component NrfD